MIRWGGAESILVIVRLSTLCLREIETQKTRKDRKTGGSDTQIAYFSEHLLMGLSRPQPHMLEGGYPKAELLFRATDLV